MKVYGIPNCGSVKKARVLLEEHNRQYEFIDFKKQPPTPELIKDWISQAGMDLVLNKRGTTWRTLEEAQKALTAESDLIALMAQHPSLIKRPIIETGSALLVGFDANKITDSI